tara:strand:+ start:744 stop:1106 length:363 start_codon:yes stop_codon:yes gene_type:complete
MKNLKTNSKEVKTLIKKHILTICKNDKENSFKKFENCAKHFYSDFDRAANYNYNLKKFPNNIERFADYLQGLPLEVRVPMFTEDLKDFLNSLGINNENKIYSYEKMINLYALLIYREITK